MRTLIKSLLALTVSLLPSSMAYAVEKPTPITTLNCTDFDGSTFSAAVYAYNFSTPPSGFFFTVYLNGTLFNQMAFHELAESGGYSVCSLANGYGAVANIVSIMEVSTTGVGIDVDAGSLSEDSIKQVFTEVDCSFSSFTFGSNYNYAKVKSKPFASPEEREKAYAAYKAKGFSLSKR